MKKLNYAKSLTQLKRKFDNSIKSMFIANIRNYINNNSKNNNNSLHSENKKKKNLSFKNKKNNIYENLNEIKKNHTSIMRSPKISNINLNNNILFFKNLNQKKNKKYHYFNDILSPNISCNITKNNSYSCNNNNIYKNKNNLEIISPNTFVNKSQNEKSIFSKKKLFKIKSPEKSKIMKEYTKYKINLNKLLNEKEFLIKNKKNKNSFYYDKFTKHLNSIGYNSIFNPIKKSPKEHLKIKKNNTKINNVRNNSKIIALKKSEIFDIKQKNEIFEKYRNNSNSNILSSIKPKIFSLENEKIKYEINSTRIYIKNKTNKTNNNSGKDQIIKYKYKLLKQLDINEFLNNIKLNKNRKKITNTNIYDNLNCSTSYNKNINKVNTSINDKYYDEYFLNNNKLKSDLYSQNSMRLKLNKNITNKNSFCSRNYNNKDENHNQIMNNSKYSNNNNQKIYYGNKTLNLDNKKIIIKKEPKIIISPISQKYKKDINIFKYNEVFKTENSNYNYNNNIHNK